MEKIQISHVLSGLYFEFVLLQGLFYGSAKAGRFYRRYMNNVFDILQAGARGSVTLMQNCHETTFILLFTCG